MYNIEIPVPGCLVRVLKVYNSRYFYFILLPYRITWLQDCGVQN